MAELVEEAMQAMVQELDDLQRKQIFDEDEIRQIVRRRRNLEYGLHRKPARQKDFLSYVQYEVAVENLRLKRVKALCWRKKSISDYAGIRRIHGIFDKGLKKFKADLKFWYQYVDFCLRSGSTKMLGRALLRAVRFHPREVPLWLLAADRMLKTGQLAAARKLLMRGLRFCPKSAKMWGEFVRLEVQVACNVEVNKANEAKALSGGSKPEAEDSSPAAATVDQWSPVLLLLRRAVARLEGRHQALSELLGITSQCITKVANEHKDVTSWHTFRDQVGAILADCRPSGDAGAHIAPDAAASLWELWWDHERNHAGLTWPKLVEEATEAAPDAALQRLASALVAASPETAKGNGTAGRALLDMAAAPRIASMEAASLAVLEALEQRADVLGQAEVSSAVQALLRQAVKACPLSVRLRAIAAKTLPKRERPLTVVDARILRESGGTLQPQVVAKLLQIEYCSLGAESCEPLLEPLLRALCEDSSAQPVVDVYLAQSLTTGMAQFRSACMKLLGVAADLWDVPKLRLELLTCVLDAELRVLAPSDMPLKQLSGRFEEVLSLLADDDPAKIGWWIRFMEFSLRVAASGRSGAGVPGVSEIHWRAARSVTDQARYNQYAFQLLQSDAT